MKKYVNLFVAAAVLLCGLVLTGCDLVKDALEGTYNQWYVCEKTLSIPLTKENDESYTGSLSAAEVYVKYNPDTGIKVAVQSTSNQDVQMFNGLISTNQTVYVGGTKEFNSSEYDSWKWVALMGSGYFEEADEPVISSGNGTCLQLVGDNGSGNITIQWQKVLRDYLIDLLLQ